MIPTPLQDNPCRPCAKRQPLRMQPVARARASPSGSDLHALVHQLLQKDPHRDATERMAANRVKAKVKPELGR